MNAQFFAYKSFKPASLAVLFLLALLLSIP